MENFVYIDRDYIQDTAGRYLKVVGNIHPIDSVVSYVKYYPDAVLGSRKIGNSLYSYNTHVPRSFSILSKEADRIIFSEFHGGVVTTTPLTKIKEHYSARQKICEVLNNRNSYISHPVGKYLLKFLELIDERYIKNVGITGSFLIDAYTEDSDIDLVCYSKDSYRYLRKIFKDEKVIRKYTGQLGLELYHRRMIYMDQIDYRSLIKQENRKLQGRLFDTDIHINCQPVFGDNMYFRNIKIFPIGEVTAIIRINEDKNSISAPGIYSIEVVDIIDSLVPNNNMWCRRITKLISYLGAYSGVFKKGEKVYVEGLLLQIIKDNKIEIGIGLTPWNTKNKFKAVLMNEE